MGVSRSPMCRPSLQSADVRIKLDSVGNCRMVCARIPSTERLQGLEMNRGTMTDNSSGRQRLAPWAHKRLGLMRQRLMVDDDSALYPNRLQTNTRRLKTTHSTTRMHKQRASNHRQYSLRPTTVSLPIATWSAPSCKSCRTSIRLSRGEKRLTLKVSSVFALPAANTW